MLVSYWVHIISATCIVTVLWPYFYHKATQCNYICCIQSSIWIHTLLQTLITWKMGQMSKEILDPLLWSSPYQSLMSSSLVRCHILAPWLVGICTAAFTLSCSQKQTNQQTNRTLTLTDRGDLHVGKIMQDLCLSTNYSLNCAVKEPWLLDVFCSAMLVGSKRVENRTKARPAPLQRRCCTFFWLHYLLVMNGSRRDVKSMVSVPTQISIQKNNVLTCKNDLIGTQQLTNSCDLYNKSPDETTLKIR